MNHLKEYLNIVQTMYSEIEARESEHIQQAAEKLSKSIMAGEIAHIFGTGHSEMVCKEVFTRAGSLSCFRIIGSHYELEKFERLEGMASIILADYEIRKGEVVIVVSSSGINALPIETAMIAKEKGAYVIAFTSLSHSKIVKPRHTSGKKLFEIADLVIDTHVPAGDAAVKLSGMEMKVGPVSSLANILIINSIVVETTASILEAGHVPPIRISRNLPAGDTHNQRFKEMYSQRIPELKL
jgi:uncharacterized phosphosugar-binding protein